MRARVPLDVDLEDRLLYGLTPVRLAYVVLAGLAGLALWSVEWMPMVVRGPLAVIAVVCGGAMAWGRWRGRAADAWAIDAVKFLLSSHRLNWIRGR
ncbi:MAG: PrgI family protein [Chloroflexi bacterium]|nr:MAG: PrgI family protein [Chloroflexota bacterium]